VAGPQAVSGTAKAESKPGGAVTKVSGDSDGLPSTHGQFQVPAPMTQKPSSAERQLASSVPALIHTPSSNSQELPNGGIPALSTVKEERLPSADTSAPPSPIANCHTEVAVNESSSVERSFDEQKQIASPVFSEQVNKSQFGMVAEASQSKAIPIDAKPALATDQGTSKVKGEEEPLASTVPGGGAAESGEDEHFLPTPISAMKMEEDDDDHHVEVSELLGATSEATDGEGVRNHLAPIVVKEEQEGESLTAASSITSSTPAETLADRSCVRNTQVLDSSSKAPPHAVTNAAVNLSTSSVIPPSSSNTSAAKTAEPVKVS
jgi:hypothetical protein